MPLLLDLFCGAGGVAKGYHDAGFDVIGVDLAPQPHYPYAFIQADALALDFARFDAIHASPPCQGYSLARHMARVKKQHPALIEPMRAKLKASGKPYVIENVPGAPLENPTVLCGTHFGLKVYRHRLFETNFPLPQRGCAHKRKLPPGFLCVVGGHARGTRWSAGKHAYERFSLAVAQQAMGIDWMNWAEISEAIPPAYTRWIGMYLRSYLEREQDDVAA